jgi:hypothetical protein
LLRTGAVKLSPRAYQPLAAAERVARIDEPPPPAQSRVLLCSKIMALNDIERKRIENTVGAFVEKFRPPPHIRPQLDFGFRFTGQSIELFEIRPQWNKPEIKHESSFAKATFVRAQGMWKVYWKRADLKWHRYEPVPEVPAIEKFLAVVKEDEYSCFFG